MRTLNGKAIVRLQTEEIIGICRQKTISNSAALNFNRVERSPIPSGKGYINNVASPGYQTLIPSTRANSVIACGRRELLPSG